MNIGNIPLFQAMQQKLRYHGARQAVLAQNIANVDTPGYRARDLAQPDFAAVFMRHATGKHMATTHTQHMQPGGTRAGQIGIAKEREFTYELNPIGNNVTVEEEVMRVAENQAEYQKVLGIYRKSLEMFRIALGKPSGG